MRNRCTQRHSRVTLTKYNVAVGQTRANIRSQPWISRPTRSRSAGLHLQMVLPLPTHCHPTPPLIPPTFPHHAAPVRQQPPLSHRCVTSPIARLATAAQHGIPVARARVTQGETQLQVVPASLLRRSSRQRVHNAIGVTIRGQKGGPLLALAPAAVDGLGTK